MAFADHEIKQHGDKQSHPPHKEDAVVKVAVKRVGTKTEKAPANIDESLRAIYEDDTGELPDMTKLDRATSRGWLIALLSFVFMGLIVGAVWVGYLVFSPYVLNANARLETNITAPETVGSFEETKLVVAYENTSKTRISGGEIRLNVPSEFHLTSTEPLPGSDTTWIINELNPGETQNIELTGYFIGESGTRAFLQSIIHYRPEGIKTDFEDIATKIVSIGASKLELSLDTPGEAIASEKTSFTYHVKNSSKVTIDGIAFKANLPTSFIISETKPRSENDGTWKIGALPSGQEAKITITGAFSSNHEDNENVGGNVFVKKDQLIIPQNEAITPIRVASGDFILRTLSNGSSEDQAIDFGNRLRISSIYKNNGNRTMKDVALNVTIDATPDELIDWKAFDEETNDDKTFMRKGETIIVNAKLMKALEELPADAEGSLSWTIPLVSTAISGTKDYRVRVKSHATIGTLGKTKVNKSIETTPFNVTPNTNLALSAGAKYFDDESMIGSGPLPPVVGKETKYAIQWKITNSVHDLKNAEIKTQLAEGVSWAGETHSEGGSISFDEGTRTVRWKLDQVSSETNSVMAQFKIILTPKTSQVDSFAPLTTGATLTALDAFTKSILTQSSDPDTTECPLDGEVKDKGIVIEKEA